MKRPSVLLKSERGAAAMEFALAAPILFALIVGIAQLGILFFANAGLQNAVAAGARLATIFPTPSDDEIKARITSSEFGLKPENVVVAATIVRGTDASGLGYADISMSYKVPLRFLFFDVPPITLSETRRVFTQSGAGS
jgi:Flp pilus assembly protein TadG